MTALRRLSAALRLVLRELRRNPRSGALVATLVALPSAAIMLVSVVLASQTPTAQERIAAELGAAEARVWTIDPSGGAILQSPSDPWEVTWDGDAVPAPASVDALLPRDAAVISITRGQSVVEAGDAFARATTILGHPWDPALDGPYEFLSGRTPEAADEVMVSPALADALDVGIGDAVSQRDAARALTVVGTMQARGEPGTVAIFASDDALEVDTDSMASEWYVLDRPIEWEQMQAFNRHGYGVYSRAVALDPPADPTANGPDSAVPAALIATGAVGLLALMLLAGAGFAVTFRSQQRDRALVAVTGATRGTLVALGTARGLWLGLAGGAAGVALGLGLGFAWVAVLMHWPGAHSLTSTWGYHVTWWHVLFVLAYGALAGSLASLIPALTASKLDAISVLRGSQRPPATRRWPALVGAALAVLGVTAMVIAGSRLQASLNLSGTASYQAQSDGIRLQVVGVILAFIGGALLVATLVRALATLTAGAGVGLRIASRDAARNSGRTVPVVTAVAIVIALASAMLLTLERDNAHDVASWQPQSPLGDATVQATSIDVDREAFATDATAAIHATLPGAHVTVIDVWDQESELDGSQTAVPYLLVPDAQVCPFFTEERESMSARDRATDPRCVGIRADVGSETASVAVGDADTLAALLHDVPSEEAESALADGGVVALVPSLIDGDEATVGLFDFSQGDYPGDGDGLARSIVLPAVYEPSDYLDPRALAVLSPEAAARIGWPTIPLMLQVDAESPVTPVERAQLEGAISRATGDDAWVDVEMGPSYGTDPAVAWFVVAIVAAFAIACTSIAVGLARADARRDDFTLASLGASPALARVVAAWQAALIVGVAASLGIALALAWVAVDSRSFVDYPFAPTWWLVGAAWVGAPVAAGLLAWVFTRAPKAIHYRLAA